MSHISGLGHAGHKPCVLELAHLSWQAACEDHCVGVMVDQPSDGPIVITGPHRHV